MDAIINNKANQIYSVLKATSLAVHYDCADKHQITIDPSHIRVSLLQLEDLVETIDAKWGPKDLNKKHLEFLDGDTHYKLRITVRPLPITTKLAEDVQHVLMVPKTSAEVKNNNCVYVSKSSVLNKKECFICANNDAVADDDIIHINKDIRGIELYRISTVSENTKHCQL